MAGFGPVFLGTRGARGMSDRDKSLEAWIWDAACSIRGAKDAGKYKDYILPLIFTKRLCDVFDDELNRIAEEVGGRAKAKSVQAREARQKARPLLLAAGAKDA